MKEKQKILIVDDTQINIDILRRILKDNDYEVLSTTDPYEAIKIVQEQDIDLILLDIVMPVLDGYEICTLLKNNESTKSIPIIFITIKSENIEKGFEVGAIDYITKPFRSSELLARVKTHLELRMYQKALEKKVKEEIEKNKKQQELVFQQNKLASMGEMIENIAHQWRQPLSTINSSVLLIDDELYQKDIQNKTITNKLSEIESMTIYMSKTIDDFRTFCRPEKDKKRFNISNSMQKVIRLIKPALDYSKIEISLDCLPNIHINGIENEFHQAILVILNNAKDALLSKNIKIPKIFIETYLEKEFFTISISDNGGGIDKENICKIFDPYFTTKHQSQGTGLGLYLSKKILQERLDARLYVENIEHGVEFNIEFKRENIEHG